MFKKENFTLIAVIAGLIILGASGYLLWRINQEGSLGSEDSDASSKLECGEYGCTKDSDCEGPLEGVEYECDEVASHIASKQKCERVSCPTGYEMADDQCTCNLIDNTCDGGGWTNKPTTVVEGGKITISGYGEDVSGVDSDSIVVKIDGAEVSASTLTLTEGSTVTSWSVTASGLSIGSHVVEASWADKEGNTSTDCELTATFTVTEAEVCNTYWWYDNDSTKCQEDEFCGDYEYSGLKVFSTESACTNSFNEANEEETPTTTSTPQTGILDEAWGKIALGFAILSAGMLFTKFNMFELDWKGVELRRKSGRFSMGKNKMNGFEKKVVKDK
jgi:hypothetical protein